MSTQFIWRKSIADNNYYCTQCGHLLIDKSGFPVGTGVTDADNPTELYCGKCGYGVAKIGYIDDSLMEMMGIEEDRDKVNCLGDFQNFYDKLKQRANKLKKKESEVDKELDNIRGLKKENEELKLKIKALQEKNIALETRNSKETEKYLKEIKKQDAEINRLYKIIENINKGV